MNTTIQYLTENGIINFIIEDISAFTDKEIKPTEENLIPKPHSAYRLWPKFMILFRNFISFYNIYHKIKHYALISK